jgi:hypothetical protein
MWSLIVIMGLLFGLTKCDWPLHSDCTFFVLP